MFTLTFLKAMLERATKSAAQGVLGIWFVGDKLFNILDADWQVLVGAGLTGFVFSALTSIASGAAPVGEPGTPSLVELPGRHERRRNDK